MSSVMVRVKQKSHQTLKQLARQSGQSMADLLDDAIEQYRRTRFLQSVHDAYAAMRADAKAWKREQKERKLWDRTLTDAAENGE